MVMLGWAMVGQSSGQTHVGIKMIKHVLCQKKWWCKANIAMICTVYYGNYYGYIMVIAMICTVPSKNSYGIWCIFYWLITRTMWMGHNLAKLSLRHLLMAGGQDAHWFGLQRTTLLSVGTQRTQKNRSVAVFVPFVPRSALWEATWRNHEAISKWRQMFPGHFLLIYIYIYIYIYTYTYIYIYIYIYR
jgi:hypothetical protein